VLARVGRIMEHSGQAFQSLDQPDHRQPIQVAVVEQVSPDSVSFVLRNHAGIAFRSTLPIPIQPRNSTIQCIFLAYFTPQVLPFSVRRLITDENRSMVRRIDITCGPLSTTHFCPPCPLFWRAFVFMVLRIAFSANPLF
jgi:hypothetical protein